ncbi:MAG TPA: DNA alkylation repair protein [Candidatus Woesebacteria bacterium]|nr:DNA alkylation repair protein [Candidatus Woesebacteria bacterium]
MSLFQQIVSDLQSRANPEKKLVLQRFFKTAPGQYGEGDVFLGVIVPDQRIVAKKYYQVADFGVVERLLASPIHEYRLTALIVLTYQFPKVELEKKQALFDFYLGQTAKINNWDLVDLSAPNIVGEYMLATKLDMERLLQLEQSPLLWERRISIISTLAFIRAVKKGRVGSEWLQPPLILAEKLLADKHDLMHKAVGWVLREVGKADERVLREFLEKYSSVMPRTALRYAIERLDEESRQKYSKR